MKLTRAARTILSITALAWALPLAQAEDKAAPRVGNAKFLQLGSNRDGYLSQDEVKVKAALLREPELRSLDVSVETYKGEVLLSGFVKDENQRARAVKAAHTVAGVAGVKDSLAVRS